MDQQTVSTPQPKNIKSFWALVIILVVAFIAAGLVYWFQFQFSYDEEIHSLEVRMQVRPHQDKAVSPVSPEQPVLKK